MILLTTNNELLDAKLKLYQALLKLSDDNMTPNELELMFHLAKDSQIQDYLHSKRWGYDALKSEKE